MEDAEDAKEEVSLSLFLAFASLDWVIKAGGGAWEMLQIQCWRFGPWWVETNSDLPNAGGPVMASHCSHGNILLYYTWSRGFIFGNIWNIR